jgi:hypothetical protein
MSSPTYVDIRKLNASPADLFASCGALKLLFPDQQTKIPRRSASADPAVARLELSLGSASCVRISPDRQAC